MEEGREHERKIRGRVAHHDNLLLPLVDHIRSNWPRDLGRLCRMSPEISYHLYAHA